jgi:hypothetical protein
MAFNIGCGPKQRAAAVVIVEVLAREIGVHDPLCVRLRDGSAPTLPSRGRFLAQELPDGCRVEFILAAKVAIEATVCEASFCHDFVDRDPVRSRYWG